MERGDGAVIVMAMAIKSSCRRQRSYCRWWHIERKDPSRLRSITTWQRRRRSTLFPSCGIIKMWNWWYGKIILLFTKDFSPFITLDFTSKLTREMHIMTAVNDAKGLLILHPASKNLCKFQRTLTGCQLHCLFGLKCTMRKNLGKHDKGFPKNKNVFDQPIMTVSNRFSIGFSSWQNVVARRERLKMALIRFS